MRVPDLEALIDAEEQQALPETRLVNALRAWKHHTIGDEWLLELCYEAWDVPDSKRRAPGISRQPPTDEGWRNYHALATILAGEYPGLGSWPVKNVLIVLAGYLVSQYAGS